MSSLEKTVEAHLKKYFDAHETMPPPGLYHRCMPLVERPLIETTLRAVGGNQIKAAAILGINRNTLRKKISTLKIKIRETK
jgi:two-component system, NtrC family, nitrogen regulation response regulator GlnG